MPTPTPPRRVPCWASTQSQPCWTGGLLERLKGLSPGHGKQRRHWATSWLVCSASWGSEFHGATCSPGVGGRPEDVHTTDLESPVCPHTWACPLADSSSSGNGMCSSICLTLLVKDLSHPSLSLSLSLRVLPVLSLSLSLPVSVSLCLSVSLWPLWFYIDLLFLLLFSLVVAWTRLFSPPSIVPYFLLVSIALQLCIMSCVDVKSSCLSEVTPNSPGDGKASDSPGGPVVKTPCCQCRRHKFDSWSGN